ncbi:MAG: hypothetical protein IKG22_00110, partial [Atopobiaceae bacterium]|nr:hypothetical protein [Atopobiaceae bacterium]
WLMTIEKMWPTIDIPNFIDNWRDDGSGMSVQALEALSAQAAEEFASESILDCLNDPDCACSIISDGALAGLVEVEGSYGTMSLATQSEDEDDGVGDFAYETVETDDGSFGFWSVSVPMGAAAPWSTDDGKPTDKERSDEHEVNEQTNATAESESAPVVEAQEEDTATEEAMTVQETMPDDAEGLDSYAEEVNLEAAEVPQDDVSNMTATVVEEDSETIEAEEKEPVVDEVSETTAVKEQAERSSIANSFVPTRSFMATQGTEDAGVKGYGREGGLVPSLDIQLASDIFSDPRSKVVDILDTPHVFRLGVTSIDGVPRTRVICDQIDGTKRGLGTRVFDTRWLQKQQLFNRVDLYDYDFDVYVEQRAGSELYVASGYIHLFLVCGRRADGTGTSISKLATDQAFGYAFFHYQVKRSGEVEFYDDLGILFPVTDFKYTSTAQGGVAHKYHMFSCPHIMPVDPHLWRGEQLSYGYSPMFFTFLDRAADHPDDVFRTDEGAGTGADPDIGLGMGFVQVEGSGTVIKFVDTSQFGFGAITDYSIYGMSCSAKMPGTDWHLIQLFGNELTHPILVKTKNTLGPNSLGVPNSVAIPAVLSIKPCRYPSDGADDYSAVKLIYWRNGDFLACCSTKIVGERAAQYGDTPAYDSHLCRVHIADLEGSPSFEFTDAGVKGVGVEGFCVDQYGDTIYWPVLRDNAAQYDVDETGGQSKSDKTDSYYAILASDFWSTSGFLDDNEGIFCEPYVFAEVDHRMDTLVLPRRSDASYQSSSMGSRDVSFINTHITDIKAGKADLWCTTMPLVRSLTVTSIEADSNIVLPGKNVNINVGVRNNGNEWLRCCKVNVCKTDGTVAYDDLLVFDEDTLLESAFNIRREDGTFENNEYDYWLAPGRSAVYRISFPVPSDWSGKTDIVVRISTLQLSNNDLSMQTQGGLTTMAESSQPMEWLQALDDEPVEWLRINDGDYEVSAEDLSPAPVTVKSKGGSSGNGTGTGTNGGASGSTNNNGLLGREAIPRTGDDGSYGGLGLAAGALGAAMVAYSKRRCQNENEKNES